MDHSYAERRQAEKNTAEKETAEQQPSLAALRSGAAQPTPGQRGRQVDLPDAMRSKMENVFGADLSAVKLYESQAVADVGSQAITQGADIAFAPGLLDFSSFSGQALLGHELSHVVSQARGEVTGGGFLNDASLEARADREGAMAAAGKTVAMPSASLSPVSAADAAGPMQAKIKPEEQSTVDTAAAQPAAAQSPPPPAHLPDAALQIPPPPARLPDAALQPFIPIPASLAPAPAVAVQAPAPAPAPPASLPPDALNAVSRMAPVPAAPAAAAAEQNAPPAAAREQDAWGFPSASGGNYSLSSGSAAFVLGRENARSKKHGKEFSDMMTALDTLTETRRKGNAEGGAAVEAMMENANRGAILGMKNYRRKLKSERGNSEDRTRQIAALKTMIRSAKGDQAAAEERGRTTLPGQEFTGVIKGGALNEVYRYARGGQGAYFKPVQRPNLESDTWTDSLKDAGIRQEQTPEETAQRLIKREIAFSRLGSLLGSKVTVATKMATMGAETPTGQIYDDRRFNSEEGRSGVLMEEAKGKYWRDYNWRFMGLTANAPGSAPSDSQSEEGAVKDALVALDRRIAGNQGKPGTTVGTRMKQNSLGFTPMSTTDHAFDYQRSKTDDERKFSDQGPELDMADPDYQQQMNQLFLLDTLAGHTDRHYKNFMVNRGEDGKIGVKAIDDDVTFGSRGTANDKIAFGKHLDFTNYTGLPAKMQIDAEMAEKIMGMDRKTLDLTFSDLLKPREIETLWTKFQLMQEYINAMQNEDKDLIVKQWNEATAKREIELAGGIGAEKMADLTQEGNFSGNNYYQRQALILNSMTNPERSEELFSEQLLPFKYPRK